MFFSTCNLYISQVHAREKACDYKQAAEVFYNFNNVFFLQIYTTTESKIEIFKLKLKYLNFCCC